MAVPLLSWLDGHGSADPGPRWLEARAGFVELGDELWKARVTVDLARLWLAMGRPGEAAALASELASILGAAAASAEDLAAIRPLGRAAATTTEKAAARLRGCGRGGERTDGTHSCYNLARERSGLRPESRQQVDDGEPEDDDGRLDHDHREAGRSDR